MSGGTSQRWPMIFRFGHERGETECTGKKGAQAPFHSGNSRSLFSSSHLERQPTNLHRTKGPTSILTSASFRPNRSRSGEYENCTTHPSPSPTYNKKMIFQEKCTEGV